LRLLALGAINRQIASQLSLAKGTVKNYVSTMIYWVCKIGPKPPGVPASLGR
jgi:hypothetical protein